MANPIDVVAELTRLAAQEKSRQLTFEEYKAKRTDLLKQTFEYVRHHYLRVSTEGPNRLTMSTFLAGFVLAALAGLIAVDSSKFLLLPPYKTWRLGFSRLGPLLHSGDWLATALFVLCAGVLVVASVVFLLAALTTYQAIQLIQACAPSTAQALQADPTGDHVAAATDPSTNYHWDVPRIERAFAIFEGSRRLISGGIILIFFSLPLFALHANLIIGAIAVVALVLALVFVPQAAGVIFRLSKLRDVSTVNVPDP